MVEINDDKRNNKFLDIATNGLGTLGHRLLMPALLRFSLITIGGDFSNDEGRFLGKSISSDINNQRSLVGSTCGF